MKRQKLVSLDNTSIAIHTRRLEPPTSYLIALEVTRQNLSGRPASARRQMCDVEATGCMRPWCALTLFSAAVRFWGQTTQISSRLSPKRDCVLKALHDLGGDLRLNHPVGVQLRCYRQCLRCAAGSSHPANTS